MKKRRGFTLIELLAVIIILAVIALIATPIILNVVENVQKKAFEQSAQGYYDAARYVYNDMMLNEDEKDTMFIFEDGVQRSDNEKYTLIVQGEVPKKGLVYLTKNGEVLVSIANDNWCATSNGNGTVELTDDPNDCGYAPLECFTFSDFTLTDTTKNYMIKQGLEFEGMDETLLQVESFNNENPACKGLVIIPNEHEGRKVEGIKGRTFMNNENITGVILSSEIKYIGAYAFSFTKLKKLEPFYLNEELRIIGGYAFDRLELNELTIPSKVASFSSRSFARSKINKLTVLNPIMQGTDYKNDSNSAFSSNNISEVILGPNVQRIPNYLFYRNLIQKLTINSKSIAIGKGAFQANRIISITIPTSVTLIENNAFSDNRFPNADAITILGDDPTRFDSTWTDIGFPAKNID